MSCRKAFHCSSNEINAQFIPKSNFTDNDSPLNECYHFWMILLNYIFRKLVRVFRGKKNGRIVQIIIQASNFAWYLVFHFWSGPKPENQYGRQNSRWPPHSYKILCSFTNSMSIVVKFKKTVLGMLFKCCDILLTWIKHIS